jgi:heterotetrameric sarcosine oxidase gamma subunit
MTLGFLSPTPDGEGGPAAESPLEPRLTEAGARFADRDGWRVATSFASEAAEHEALRVGAGIVDRSALGKLELQGAPAALDSLLASVVPGGPPESGTTAELDGATLWLPSPDRALAICEPAAVAGVRDLLESVCGASPRCGLVELTAGFAAIELRGPRAGALLERLTAIDVRDAALPVGGVRAGAIAEVAATLLRPADEAFLFLVAAQQAADAWEIVIDAGAPLGARPVGSEALARIERRTEEGARA